MRALRRAGFNPPWPTEVGPMTRHSCQLWALFYVNNCPIQHLPHRDGQRFTLLLLHSLFHADGVGHQLRVAQNR